MLQLSRFANLRELEIDFNESQHFSDRGIAVLEKLTRLRRLSLGHADLDGRTGGVDDRWLLHIGSLKQLEFLAIGGNKVTDVSISHIVRLTNLYRLDLSCSQVSDAGLVYLADMDRLEVLDISYTRATEMGAAKLARMTCPRRLCLPGRMADSGIVERLKVAIPQCNVDCRRDAEF